jgi:hypothetical protein
VTTTSDLPRVVFLGKQSLKIRMQDEMKDERNDPANESISNLERKAVESKPFLHVLRKNKGLHFLY